MEKSPPSTTAQVAASMRALHLLVGYDPKTFLDPQAVLLIDTEGANILRSLWADILNQKLIPVRCFEFGTLGKGGVRP